jgi:AcrR family transcriptional regulator
MARQAKAKKRTNNPEGTRGKILDAAADLFQMRGYHDTAMQDVRDAAGVTSGALQHHFPSKKALGLAVVKDRVADALRSAWLEPIEQAPSVAEGISVSMGEIAASLDSQGFVRGCPVNNLAVELAFADLDFRRALQSIFDEWQEAIAAKLRAEAAPSSIECSPDALATLVVAAYSGAMNMAKAEQSSRALEITRALLVSLLRFSPTARSRPRRAV